MNKIEKGKVGLLVIGIITLVLALAGVGCGIWLTVASAKGISVAATAGNIIGLVCGIILIVVGFVLLYVGIHLTWVASVLKATKGSIADDNLGKGTINMIKCPKCGSEVSPEDKVCGNCGAKLAKTVNCPACGEEVDAFKKICTKCGAELK